MIKNFLNSNPLLFYLIKFIGIFCICYFGTLAVIGLSVTEGYYSSFIDKYLDYVSILRYSLLHGSKFLVSLLGYKALIADIFSLRIEQGKEVHIGFDCLGYGVMSFWIAFVVANKGTFIKKLKWVLGGLFLIWLINVTRISMLLVAINNHWVTPYFDHHTWFNIFAYLQIFILIFFYDRSAKTRSRTINEKTSVFNITDQ